MSRERERQEQGKAQSREKQEQGKAQSRKGTEQERQEQGKAGTAHLGSRGSAGSAVGSRGSWLWHSAPLLEKLGGDPKPFHQTLKLEATQGPSPGREADSLAGGCCADGRGRMWLFPGHGSRGRSQFSVLVALGGHLSPAFVPLSLHHPQLLFPGLFWGSSIQKEPSLLASAVT